MAMLAEILYYHLTNYHKNERPKYLIYISSYVCGCVMHRLVMLTLHKTGFNSTFFFKL